MTFKSGDTVPYAPPQTVIDVLRRIRDRGLPVPVTSEILERAGVSETLSNRTLQTLKLLNFLDAEGAYMPEFDAANRAPEDQYKSRLGDLILGKYQEVVTFADPGTDSYERVRDAFRGFNPVGQQDRMVSLFLGLLDYVGADTSAATRKRPDGAPAAPQRSAAPRSQRPKKSVSANRNGSPTKSDVARREPADDLAELPPGLVGLLRQIPLGGAGWSAATRNTFIEAFTAVLNFSVPVRDHEPEQVATEVGDAEEDNS